MTLKPNILALRARFVFPVAGPCVPGGFVTIENDRIVAVGPHRPDCPIRDLGDVAIVPGLINAHTHLEFSDLQRPLGHSGMALPDWIRLVMGHRRDGAAPVGPCVARGLAESVMAGTTAAGEIATSDWRPATERPRDRPAIVMFRELIAPTAPRAAAARATAEEFLRAELPVADIWPALSPHAPYTVQVEVVEALVELSRQFDVPLAMHLAESREELELLVSRGGPLRLLLQDVGAWDPRPEARHAQFLDYLRQLARAPRALVVHGNYLNAAELDFLAERAGTMSVVYCPRTHDYFRHDPYPLAQMLAQGVSVALGTDSRASNPDLSLFEELRWVAEHHPAVAPAQVLELGTVAGARALRLDEQMGTLEPGKLAHLAVVRVPGAPVRDPHELLFGSLADISQTWIGGRLIHEQ